MLHLLSLGAPTPPGAFHAIHKYYSPEQEKARLHGQFGEHQKRYKNFILDNRTSWWADKPGNWHSQSKQDQTVASLFEGKSGGTHFFVDLAANHPIILSNTRALERDHGWQGVCIDGNKHVLALLVAQRACKVYEGVVTAVSGQEVVFTAPTATDRAGETDTVGSLKGDWVNDAFSGILSDSTDNKVVKVEKGKGKGTGKQPSSSWAVIKHTSVRSPLLTDANAPSTIDYLSGRRGAEYDALSTFLCPVSIHRDDGRAASEAFARPQGKNGYVYVKDLDCTFGEQLWVHGSFANKAARKLGLAPLDPSRDMAECCADPSKGRPASSIDSGCCGTSNTAECNAGAAPVFSKGR